MRAMRGLWLIALFAFAGCGADRFTLLTPNEIPIVPSDQIATGAWTLGGLTATGSNTYTNPIGGFYGAISVYNGQIVAGLTIASSNANGSPLGAACLGNTYYATASGTAKNGTLTLDSDFAGSHMHLVAQLSVDRQSITSGSFTVTGACAMTAPAMNGQWNAPLTGTYVGQGRSMSGATKTITAVLTQANYFFDGGYIPVDGSFAFASGGCTTNVVLRSALVIGNESDFGGYSVAGQAYNDALILGEEDNPNSATLTLDSWNYSDPVCGTDIDDGINPGVLIRK